MGLETGPLIGGEYMEDKLIETARHMKSLISQELLIPENSVLITEKRVNRYNALVDKYGQEIVEMALKDAIEHYIDEEDTPCRIVTRALASLDNFCMNNMLNGKLKGLSYIVTLLYRKFSFTVDKDLASKLLQVSVKHGADIEFLKETVDDAESFLEWGRTILDIATECKGAERIAANRSE